MARNLSRAGKARDRTPANRNEKVNTVCQSSSPPSTHHGWPDSQSNTRHYLISSQSARLVPVPRLPLRLLLAPAARLSLRPVLVRNRPFPCRLPVRLTTSHQASQHGALCTLTAACAVLGREEVGLASGWCVSRAGTSRHKATRVTRHQWPPDNTDKTPGVSLHHLSPVGIRQCSNRHQ